MSSKEMQRDGLIMIAVGMILLVSQPSQITLAGILQTNVTSIQLFLIGIVITGIAFFIAGIRKRSSG